MENTGGTLVFRAVNTWWAFPPAQIFFYECDLFLRHLGVDAVPGLLQFISVYMVCDQLPLPQSR